MPLACNAQGRGRDEQSHSPVVVAEDQELYYNQGVMVADNCCQGRPQRVGSARSSQLPASPECNSGTQPNVESAVTPDAIPGMECCTDVGADAGSKSEPDLQSRTPSLPAALPTTTTFTFANRWDHVLAYCGIRRNRRRTKPGLYSLGNPAPGSPVFVTANYRLSFDALRFALREIDCYILVLDTRGINVWCAAGKGTFGTDELVSRVKSAGLSDVVSHRLLILPQLGAAGVSAHEVKKRSGFRVEYGPIRTRDLPEYLKTHKADPEMRRVRFGLADRMILIPVELLHVLVPMLVAAAVLFVIAGPLASFGTVAAILAGVVLFPILLPWLPTPNFSTKGLILGALVALPFGSVALLGVHAPAWLPDNPGSVSWLRAGWAAVCVLAMAPVTAYVSLNFTGSTPFTSRTGVRREIFTYIPIMAWMLGGAIVLTIILSIMRLGRA